MAINYETNLLGDITFGHFPLIHLTDIAVADKIYPVVGEPYIQYAAPGKDDEGNEYLVSWDTTNEWDEKWAAYNKARYTDTAEGEIVDIDEPFNDESDACDWVHPVKVEAL